MRLRLRARADRRVVAERLDVALVEQPVLDRPRAQGLLRALFFQYLLDCLDDHERVRVRALRRQAMAAVAVGGAHNAPPTQRRHTNRLRGRRGRSDRRTRTPPGSFGDVSDLFSRVTLRVSDHHATALRRRARRLGRLAIRARRARTASGVTSMRDQSAPSRSSAVTSSPASVTHRMIPMTLRSRSRRPGRPAPRGSRRARGRSAHGRGHHDQHICRRRTPQRAMSDPCASRRRCARRARVSGLGQRHIVPNRVDDATRTSPVNRSTTRPSLSTCTLTRPWSKPRRTSRSRHSARPAVWRCRVRAPAPSVPCARAAASRSPAPPPSRRVRPRPPGRIRRDTEGCVARCWSACPHRERAHVGLPIAEALIQRSRVAPEGRPAKQVVTGEHK
jgi:hypothetical protein